MGILSVGCVFIAHLSGMMRVWSGPELKVTAA
jgi:hypothetical protein